MTHTVQLTEFRSTDNIVLPALLFTPNIKTSKIALYLHGNGSSSVFYSVKKMNTLAKTLSQNGIAFFPFNNRGAHYIHKLTKGIGSNKTDVKMGTANELIKDCVYDIDGAIDFLKDKGFNTFYLIGSSTGANKIVVYHFYKRKNPVSKYILLSGGDDTGLYYEMLGRKKFKNLLSKSKKAVKENRGGELVTKYLEGGLMSNQSLFDTINPDGDYNIFPFNEYMNKLDLSKKNLFQEFTTIDKPTLVIYGEQDEYCYGNASKCMAILEDQVRGNPLFIFKIIKNTDHGFHGKESELSQTISLWLKKNGTS